MKWIIWTIGGVLAALWTGILALTALVVDWTATALRQAGPGAATTPSLPPELPAWLSAWIEPGTWEAAVRTVDQALQSLQAVLPDLGRLTGWLEPVLWTLWGLGMVALLAVAAGSHWWIGRRGSATAVRA